MRRRRTCEIHTRPARSSLDRSPDEPCGLLASHYYEDAKGRDVWVCRKHAPEMREHYRLRPITPKESGLNIPEAQRGTVAIKLRLLPDVAERLRLLAGDGGVSAWVAARVQREAGQIASIAMLGSKAV